MSRSRLGWTLLAAMVAGSVAGGCASPKGYERAAVTSKRMTDVRADVVAVKGQVREAVAALDELVNQPKADLRPQYARFEKAVDRLDKLGQQVRDRALDMRAKRADYVKAWKAQAGSIQNEQLRGAAEARMGEADAAFARLSDQLHAVRDAATPFMADLRDLRRFLSADLTPAGLAATRDVAAKIIAEEKPLQGALDELIVSLDERSSAMAPTGTAR